MCNLCDLQGTGTCIIEAAKTGHYGTQPTDVRQLKAAIALVREAGYYHICESEDLKTFDCVLSVIEQRAAV
jgi:hypothetical protein